ncbi:3-methyl-2-oxobutanoate hydroxymethyltransferase [Granulosicoccus antarcticus]|uniref:3-methyl-2-oxobutanoate hydroxymethyltransferase n=1 Tax=Granulosicoccus antarcticus IMCC3135 TaxID=1192854 RepID=A0A2Z2NXU4_9GAMM|nr:3-methyl-2-oxobutanoate hydroxymethyltransferase [Granulosicoccus antarcticus]ASJ71964.1 3-methyl-2-oxobutanoate hydroxymethyltransferase [Granulosicoccus antarcticus IMCC3135]
MKHIYTAAGQPASRTVTIADMRSAKGQRKLVQVTANTADEAMAVQEAGIDMMICDAANAHIVRAANPTTFCTAAVKLTEHATTDDIMREAYRVMHLGVDAIITPRSFKTVEILAREDIPVMGHLGLVPRKSIWLGGLRAVGKTATEAQRLFRDFKSLEDAGAFAVESEVIAGPVMAEIAPRTSLICVSLGSGSGGDVTFLFMNDLCGETANPPRHARAFGNLAALHEALYKARVQALNDFRVAALEGEFPTVAQTPTLDDNELAIFRKALQSEQTPTAG